MHACDRQPTLDRPHTASAEDNPAGRAPSAIVGGGNSLETVGCPDESVQQARRCGTAYAAVLGVGLDALTLAATILTAVVLGDDVFGQAFGDAVRCNEEGEIVAIAGGVPTDGVPFTDESVRRLLEREPMASPGPACLSLAWQHRSQLLGL